MLVLTLDTATPTVAAGVVAVSASGGTHELLAERTVADPFGHAEYLMPLATGALAETGHALGELDAVVVGTGPGPFTGLRVGLATAAALGEALAVPVYGVPSHDAVALAASPREPFLVVTDARRREVYLSAYAADGRRLSGPVVLAPAAVPALLAEQGLAPRQLAGAGAELLARVLDLPVAQGVGSICLGLAVCAERALAGGGRPGPLTPLYLRRPDATEPTRRKSVLGA